MKNTQSNLWTKFRHGGGHIQNSVQFGALWLIMYNQPDMVRLFKVRQLQWAGHLLRSDEHRCIKKSGWEHLIEDDLLGVIDFVGKIESPGIYPPSEFP